MSDTAMFLDWLYGDAEGHVYLATKDVSDDRFRVRGSVAWPNRKDKLLKAIRASKDNVYVSAYVQSHPSKRTANGGHTGPAKGDAVRRRVLHCDIDHNLTDEQARRVRDLKACVVESGSAGHVHVYLRLARDLPAAEHDRYERALRDYLGGDSKVSDSDFMRVVGSVNYRTGAEVTWDGGTSTAWDVQALSGVLQVDADGMTGTEHRNGGVGVARDVEAVRPRGIKDAVRNQMDRGHHAANGDRSEVLFALVGACADAGMSEAEAQWCVDQCEPLVEKLGGRTIAREWSKVSQRVARTAQAPDESPRAPDESGVRHVVLTPASKIKPRPVFWLWDGRLALGTLGLLAGREGLGKSTLAYWLAARITRGDLQGEFIGQPRGVLVCATEDSWEHTIVPRLMAAGADLERVYRVEVRSADDIQVGLSLPRDLVKLEHAATEAHAALLLLDPLMSRLGDLDTHKDSEVRQALEPLVGVADRASMSILGLIHHNKSGAADPLQLVMGSKAFTAVARSVHTVVPDPDDDGETRRLFGTPKNNLGRSNLPTLSFTIESHAIDTDEGTAWTGRIEWGDEVAEGIGEVMRRTREDTDRTAIGEAAQWLRDYLDFHDGRVASAEAKDAAKKAGHTDASIRRARERLKVRVESEGFPRTTFWVASRAPVVPHRRGESAQLT